MKYLTQLISWLFELFERIKGATRVIEVKTPKNLVGQLTGYSIYGYELQIFCQKRHFRRSYDKWFIPNENHIAYRVFSIVSNNAPAKLKKACELDIVIPQLMNDGIDERRQRQAAIDAYLDILAQSLVSPPSSNEYQEYLDHPPGIIRNDVFDRINKSRNDPNKDNETT